MKYLMLFITLLLVYRAEAKLFPVFDEDYVSYIDSTGTVILEGNYYPQFEKSKFTVNGKDFADIKFRESAFFHQGVAFVRVPFRLFGLFTIWNDYHFIDKTGKVILESHEPDFFPFSDGYSKFIIQKTPLQYGIINGRGERVTIIDTVHTSLKHSFVRLDRVFFITDFSGGKALVLSTDVENTPYTYVTKDKGELYVCDVTFEEADIYSEGLAGFKKDGLWGYMDHDFDPVIEPQYDFATPFNGGFAKVMKGKYFGYINKKGDLVIPAKYHKMGILNEGYVAALEGERWGLLDAKGNWVIKPQYFNMGNYHNGLIPVEKDGKYGYVNTKNEVVIPLDYDYAEDFDSGLAKVWVNGELFYIDTKGNRIWTILDAAAHNSVIQDVKRDS